MNQRIKCLIAGTIGPILEEKKFWLEQLPRPGTRIEIDAEKSYEVMTLYYHYDRISGTDMVDLKIVTIIVR